MEAQDWKAKLGAAFNIAPNEAEDTQENVAAKSPLEQQGKQKIDIILDKKGRNGKQATIIANLHLDDEALKELASDLKRACSAGGSARGGEILIQGDKRDKVLSYLINKGYKARII